MFARLYDGKSLLLWVVLTYALFAVAARVLGPFREDEILAGRALATALYLLPPLWLLHLLRRGRPDPAGLFPRRAPGLPLRLGLGWFAATLVFRPFAFLTLFGLLAMAFPDFVEAWLLRDFRIVELPEADHSLPITVLGLLLALVLAPISEEIIFRGVLLHRFWHQWGLAPAVLGTSALFALLHADFFGTFVMALILCLMYLHSRSLWYPVLFHALNNALAVAGELADTFGMSRAVPFSAAWLQENWWRGLPFGLISIPWIVLILKRNWPRLPPF